MTTRAPLACALLVFAACKDEPSPLEKLDEAKKAAEAAQKMAEEAAKSVEAQGEAAKAGAEGAAAMAEAMAQAAGQAGGVEPVSHTKLKELLPEKLADLPRKEASGEKVGMGGMKISHALGRYGEGDSTVELKLVDMGSMKGLAAMAATGWAMVEVDRESDDGYERTIKIDGKKAFERWSKGSKNGELKVIVGERFVVELNSYGVEMDALKKAFATVDLAKLEALKSATE